MVIRITKDDNIRMVIWGYYNVVIVIEIQEDVSRITTSITTVD